MKTSRVVSEIQEHTGETVCGEPGTPRIFIREIEEKESEKRGGEQLSIRLLARLGFSRNRAARPVDGTKLNKVTEIECRSRWYYFSFFFLFPKSAPIHGNDNHRLTFAFVAILRNTSSACAQQLRNPSKAHRAALKTTQNATRTLRRALRTCRSRGNLNIRLPNASKRPVNQDMTFCSFAGSIKVARSVSM